MVGIPVSHVQIDAMREANRFDFHAGLRIQPSHRPRH